MGRKSRSENSRREPFIDAEGADDDVDGLAYRDAGLAQLPVPAGGPVCPLAPQKIEVRQARHGAPCRGEVRVGPKALKHFQQDQVAGCGGLGAQQGVQMVGLGRLNSIEVVDPDTGVDQDHRSRLIFSRSPVHRSLPRNPRMSSCSFSRISDASPSSTASRLVLAPVARIAPFRSSSSMTMFVRNGRPSVECVLIERTIHMCRRGGQAFSCVTINMLISLRSPNEHSFAHIR